jgi:hypothetical protein
MIAVPKRPRLIVAKGEGQLGNRLFQAASFLAASYEKGIEVWNPAFGEYADFFPAISRDFLCRPDKNGGWVFSRSAICQAIDLASGAWGETIVKALGGLVLDISQSHDARDVEYDLCGEHFSNILRWKNFVIVKGWKFRASEAMWKHRSKIREVFKPNSQVTNDVTNRISEARLGTDLLVGVHVRVGDYAEWQGGRYFYGLELYMRWMRQLVAMNSDCRVGFLVCSNGDINELLMAEGLRVTRGPGRAVEDLYALASCDRLIGPPSTFTLWASYFGQVPLHMLESADQILWEGGFVIHENV